MLKEALLAGAIAASGISLSEAVSPETQPLPDPIEDAADDFSFPKSPSLQTEAGFRVVMPMIGADSGDKKRIDPRAEIINWITPNLPQNSSQYDEGLFHRRDCSVEPTDANTITCESDFEYGENANGIFKSTFGNFDEAAGDGHDRIKIGDKWVKIISTQDHTGTQVFMGEKCSIDGYGEGGWILFPVDFVNNLSIIGSEISNIKQVYVEPNGDAPCPANNEYDQSYTSWDYVPQYQHADGIKRNTIIVKHHHSGDPNVSGREEFYFTKELGFTQWKSVDSDDNILDQRAWVNVAKSPKKTAPWPIQEVHVK